MNLRKLLLSATALSAVAMSVSVANAADIARPVVRRPVVAAVPYYNWTGFYVGGHFGGGWGRNEFSETACGGSPTLTCGPNWRLQALEINPQTGFHGLLGSGGDVGSHQFSGALGGFQVGYNWQIGRFLIGVEGQFSWSDMKGDHQNTTSGTHAFAETLCPANTDACGQNGVDSFFETFTGTNSDRLFSKVKNFGTIAARLGLVGGAEGRTLFYAKGGAGYANTDYLLVQQFSAVRSQFGQNAVDGSPMFLETDALQGGGAFTGSATRWGPMAGVGLEFALFDGWTAKVEYDHLFLGTKSVDLTGTQAFILRNPGPAGGETLVTPGSAGGTRTFDVRQDINIIKFGLNYRFGNFYAAPVVTK
jgi:outer membrane immunogenic protein